MHIHAEHNALAIFALDNDTDAQETRNPSSVFAMPEVQYPSACIAFSQVAPITYSNRPSLQAFIEDIRRSKNLEQKELAGALPQIALGGRVAKTDFQLALESAFPKRAVSFSIRQLLWSFAGPIQQYRIQRTTTNVNEEAERFHRTTIRLESELTFLDALLTMRKKNRIKALDVSSKYVFAQGETNKLVGFLSNSAWRQVESNFATAQTEVMRYTYDVKRSFTFLERALSIPLTFESNNDTPQLIMEHGLLAFKVDPIDHYLEHAVHFRHDLAMKAWEVDRAEKTSSILLNRYAPTINFSFDVLRNNFTTSLDNNTKQLTFQVGIDASWTFDSFANAHESHASDAQMVSLKMQQLDLSLAIQRDVKAAYYDLESLLKEVKAEEARYQTAEAQFNSQEDRLQIGQISEVDFHTAYTNLQNAKYALDTQKIAAEKKYRELLFACGYPPEFEQITNLWSHK